jgi:hypothetical protein
MGEGETALAIGAEPGLTSKDANHAKKVAAAKERREHMRAPREFRAEKGGGRGPDRIAGDSISLRPDATTKDANYTKGHAWLCLSWKTEDGTNAPPHWRQVAAWTGGLWQAGLVFVGLIPPPETDYG